MINISKLIKQNSKAHQEQIDKIDELIDDMIDLENDPDETPLSEEKQKLYEQIVNQK